MDEVASNGTWPAGVPSNDTAPWVTALITVSTCLAVLAAVLNTCTVLVIARLPPAAYKPRLRLVLSLSLTDLALSVGLILFIAINGRTVLYIYDVPDSLHILVNLVLKHVEACGILLCLFNLLAIAVDQLIVVVLPTRYISIVTGARMNRVVIGLWVSTFVIMALPIIGNCLGSRHHSDILACVSVGRGHIAAINSVVCMTSMPAFVTIYGVVYGRVRRLQRSISNPSRAVSLRKAAVTSVILVVPFILVYLPVSVYVMLVWTPDVRITWPFWELFMMLLALNTAVDPVIYAARMPPIRRGYTALVCGKQRSGGSMTTSN